MHAAARYAVIALIVLPLLPDQAYGPYAAWNPRQLWMVVVLVTGLSFAGYVAGKRLGAARGTLAAADRKSTRLNSITNAQLVCRLLLEKKKKQNQMYRTTRNRNNHGEQHRQQKTKLSI